MFFFKLSILASSLMIVYLADQVFLSLRAHAQFVLPNPKLIGRIDWIDTIGCSAYYFDVHWFCRDD
jgi:hypothetical protein